MKQLLLIVFSLGMILSCKSQNVVHMEKFNIEDFNKHNKSGIWNYVTDDGITIEELSYAAGYARTETKKNSLFSNYALFYKNGSIKETGQVFIRGNFQKGTWTYYDASGKIEKTVDYDKPFLFTYEDVVKYCRENKIDLHDSHTFIDSHQEPPQWEINFLHEGKNRSIVLDGKTGKKLKETDLEIIK